MNDIYIYIYIYIYIKELCEEFQLFKFIFIDYFVLKRMLMLSKYSDKIYSLHVDNMRVS